MDYFYSKDLKFPYKFIMCSTNSERPTPEQRQEVLEWIKENCGSYNKDHIYWGLKDRITEPRWVDSEPEVYFKTEEYATAFKLRWM